MVKSNLHYGKPLNNEERERIKQVCTIISSTSFLWSSTSQGTAYWREVVDALYNIATEVPTCESCGQKLPE